MGCGDPLHTSRWAPKCSNPQQNQEKKEKNNQPAQLIMPDLENRRAEGLTEQMGRRTGKKKGEVCRKTPPGPILHKSPGT